MNHIPISLTCTVLSSNNQMLTRKMKMVNRWQADVSTALPRLLESYWGSYRYIILIKLHGNLANDKHSIKNNKLSKCRARFIAKVKSIVSFLICSLEHSKALNRFLKGL